MKWVRFRAFVVLLLVFTGFCLVVMRAVQIQVFPDDQLVKFVENKDKWNKKKSESEILQSRGSIVDRNENVLSMSLISKSFFANPRLVDQPKTVAMKLARHLNLKAGPLEKLLSSDKFFVWVKREVAYEKARKVEALEIPGLHTSKESRRVYPHGEIGKSILGVVGRDGKGLEGVELSYENWLQASDKSEAWGLRDALGRGLRFQDYERQWFEAQDVVLSIDLRLQKIVEEELRKAIAESESLYGQAVMMNPRTGAVMAMASVDGERKGKSAHFRNRSVSDVFEPGSTFKLVVAMAGLEKLHLSPSSQIYGEKGVLRVGPNQIREYNNRKFEWMTLTEMLSKSSNVAAAKLGLKVGAENFYDTIKRFGFGEKTGLDFPGEAKGLLRRFSRWKPIELANISFGQGIAVTGIQMARAFSAVANGGFLVKPYLVERVQAHQDEKKVLWKQPIEKKEVFKAEDVRALKEMLLAVTAEGGTGGNAAIPGFQVAGKTGTSQKLVEREGRNGKTYKAYSSEASIVSFGGFVPVEDPAFVLYVMIDEPVKRSSGGSLAAPVWRKIASRSLGVLGVGRVASPRVRPERTNEESLFVGQSFRDVLGELRSWEESKRKKVELIGFGTAIREEVFDDRIRVYFE